MCKQHNILVIKRSPSCIDNVSLITISCHNWHMCLILRRTMVGVGSIINSGRVNTQSWSIHVMAVDISTYTITSHPHCDRSCVVKRTSNSPAESAAVINKDMYVFQTYGSTNKKKVGVYLQKGTYSVNGYYGVVNLPLVCRRYQSSNDLF